LNAQDAVAQLAAAESAITSSPELDVALLSPAVQKDRKIAVVSKVADKLGVHRIIRNFLLVVTSHRRIHELRAMRQEFESVVDERLGWLRAEITSAHELTPQQREEIERALGEQLGKFIRAEYKLDPAVLGGVRARVASREYDATLAGRLSALRQELVANA
jgi:F-type H+-transporting ATPase subunit delta